MCVYNTYEYEWDQAEYINFIYMSDFIFCIDSYS